MNRIDFLRRVQDKLNLADMSEAETATRSVLAALTDRITDDEANDLASQLPHEFNQFIRRRTGPLEKMDKDIFVGRIQGDLDIDSFNQAADVTMGVFSVIKEAVSSGEWEDVATQLPSELEEMFIKA